MNIISNQICIRMMCFLKSDTLESAEKIISKDPRLSYFYSSEIIRKRFPKGEKEIAKVPLIALDYARNVLKDRFAKAEKNFISSPEICYNYFKYVVQAKLPVKMHNAMLMASFEKPINKFVEKYFQEVL